ncbi:TlpA family protein disulfide reductase [Chitinophaga qingshengii]|uniref:TlpA family protein disulfide reductase n=1 Tax=Chitinophaga qingshengii TaxID=1569794 RepID=A0ABR7TQY4_9BACT|nr:TlpA disulfide reductase family protein [Chitinophaga qingshengii]MBC9932885.1 TlpA family protein disulfide reductase [Chitinophaga qingshengii]
MKQLPFYLVLGLLPVTAGAQQLKLSSAIHADAAKVTIYQEWPERKLVDTPHLSAKVAASQLPQAGAVYTVSLRQPFVNVTVLGEKGTPINITIDKDSQVIVKGGTLQRRLDSFQRSIAPDEKAWSEAGRRYETTTDLDTKLAINKEMDHYAGKVQQARLQFAINNANNLAGAWMAYSYAFAWTPASLEKLMPLFRPQPAAKVTYTVLQQKQAAAAAVSMTGKQAPVFALSSIDGHQVALDSLFRRHRYVLLDVWASWCTPCRAGNRKLAEYYEELSKKGIGFVSVSVDENKELWKKAVASDKIPWLQLVSPNGMKSDFVQAYKVQSLPAMFLINREGNIVQQHIDIEALKKL